jgi:hypothetical protein
VNGAARSGRDGADRIPESLSLCSSDSVLGRETETGTAYSGNCSVVPRPGSIIELPGDIRERQREREGPNPIPEQLDLRGVGWSTRYNSKAARFSQG